MYTMIEKTKFMGFEAVRLENAKKDELIVLTEVGPRIMSFRPEGGENFFYVNGSELTPGVKGSETWHSFGGTRLWISPETELTYTPDNVPSEVLLEKNRLTVTSPVDKKTKLRKKITIEVQAGSFTITYMLRNEGKHLFTAGLWTLSCVQPLPGAEIYLPWGEESEWNIKDMKYWKSWLGVGSNIESAQWRPTNEFFIIRPSGEIGKVGFANPWSFALYKTENFSFIKKTEYIVTSHYPDGGCSCEVYTCSDFYEMETLSPIYTIKPGLTFTHREKWWAGTEKVDLNSIRKTYDRFQTLIP